jgi:PTS system ascorbate-specific IIA component
MLEQIVKDQLVCVQLHAQDWKDAIKKSAQPLIDDGDITSGYVDGIFESVKEFGPYFVIAPHVALAHAPSKDGAKKLALGVAVLSEPVDFHNKDNDPVKYIFTLSSPDSNSHLKAMQELVTLMSDSTFYEKLDSAKSSHEVVEIMSGK